MNDRDPLTMPHPIIVVVTARDHKKLSELVLLAGSDRHDVICDLIRKAHAESFPE